MNRYVLAAVLGAIAFLTLLGIGNSQDMLRRSRNSLSATPSSAAESNNLTGIDSAGQNVLRQTSPEAIERLPNVADGTTPQPTLNPGATEPTSPTDPNATPPVPPSTAPPPTPAPETPPPTDQEAIPALW